MQLQDEKAGNLEAISGRSCETSFDRHDRRSVVHGWNPYELCVADISACAHEQMTG